jgi:preprotein translocase subunit SecY
MVSVALQPGNWLYMYVYVGLIVFFSYFYTAIMFNPVDVADNLKKSGAYIPGIRPGKQTADFIDRLLMRLTGAGALYLAAVCILPTLVADRWGVPFSFGGTGLLIVVGVSMDTVAQIEAQLLTKYYDGIQGPMVGGRRKFLIHSANESL